MNHYSERSVVTPTPPPPRPAGARPAPYCQGVGRSGRQGAIAMKLTKYEHACVAFENGGGTIVIDPGSFSPSAPEIIAGASALLLTHEHADHVNEDAITAALEA